jgi:hypothetical protein
MRRICLTALSLAALFLVTHQQVVCSDLQISLPKPDEVAQITVEPGLLNWYTPESLLKLLPYFVPSQGVIRRKKFLQRGTLVLKNGTVLHWKAGGNTSLQIHTEQERQLFVLPAECALTELRKRIALKPPGSRVFQHTGVISMSYSSVGTAVTLNSMPLEDGVDRLSGPAVSAEFQCHQGHASTVVSFHLWLTKRLRGESLALFADSRLLKRVVPRKPTDASLEDLGIVVYTIKLQRNVFLNMLSAQKVEVRAGRRTFTLSADHVNALRDLVSRME